MDHWLSDSHIKATGFLPAHCMLKWIRFRPNLENLLQALVFTFQFVVFPPGHGTFFPLYSEFQSPGMLYDYTKSRCIHLREDRSQFCCKVAF